MFRSLVFVIFLCNISIALWYYILLILQTTREHVLVWTQTPYGCGAPNGIWNGYETTNGRSDGRSYVRRNATAGRSQSHTLLWEASERCPVRSSSDDICWQHHWEGSGCDGPTSSYHLWACCVLEESSGSNRETSGKCFYEVEIVSFFSTFLFSGIWVLWVQQSWRWPESNATSQ